MDIREMHYIFKFDLNKLDSNQNRDLFIPEIDVLLNRALSMYVNNIFFPRSESKGATLEETQRNLDNLRPLVVNGDELPSLPVSPGKRVDLPDNYWHYLKATALAKKGNCERVLRMYTQKHDNLFEENSLYKSSFEWETLNFLFTDQGLQLYFEDFDVTEVKLSYIKTHPYIHNARDYEEGKYENLNGNILTGHQNCELPDDACRNIVDLAVFLASSSLESSGYNNNKEKLIINQTI